MDIANLRAFAAVASCRSFSLAAQQLALTQPAVSKRVAVLEARLAVTLFDRLGRQIELTEAGRALLQRIPDIEQSLRLAEDAVRQLDGEVTGPLKIATSHHIGLHRLPPILSAYQREYPSVQLDIEFLDSEQAYERLRVGSIELAVITLAPGNVAQLKSAALWHDPLSVMVARKHPLAEKQAVTLQQLGRFPAVLPGLDTFTGQIVQQHFASVGVTLDLRMATNYLETLRMMAIVGLGWTVLPDTMVTAELVCLPLHGTQLSRTLGLLQHGERSLSRCAQAFVEMLQPKRPSPA